MESETMESKSLLQPPDGNNDPQQHSPSLSKASSGDSRPNYTHRPISMSASMAVAPDAPSKTNTGESSLHLVKQQLKEGRRLLRRVRKLVKSAQLVLESLLDTPQQQTEAKPKKGSSPAAPADLNRNNHTYDGITPSDNNDPQGIKIRTREGLVNWDSLKGKIMGERPPILLPKIQALLQDLLGSHAPEFLRSRHAWEQFRYELMRKGDAVTGPAAASNFFSPISYMCVDQDDKNGPHIITAEDQYGRFVVCTKATAAIARDLREQEAFVCAYDHICHSDCVCNNEEKAEYMKRLFPGRMYI